jgi:hypothetical protein
MQFSKFFGAGNQWIKHRPRNGKCIAFLANVFYRGVSAPREWASVAPLLATYKFSIKWSKTFAAYEANCCFLEARKRSTVDVRCTHLKISFCPANDNDHVIVAIDAPLQFT